MRKVRRGVFETNSSSTHALVISDVFTGIDTIPVQDDGKVHIFPGEFGWGPEVYHDAPAKASYCYTHALNDGTLEDMDMLRVALEDYLVSVHGVDGH